MGRPGFFSTVGGFLADAMGFGGPPDPTNDRWWSNGATTMSMAGISVTDDIALQLDVVQSILERLSGTISTLPLMVFKRTGKGGGRKPANDHPLYKLLHDAPNPRQTPQEFWQEIVTHLAFWRNIYCLITPGVDYAIGALEPIHPTRLVKIVKNSDGHRYYTFTKLPPEVGNVTYRDDEIWHVRKPRLTVDGLRGMSMIETSRETFGRAVAVEQFGSMYFKNGGSGGGVLEHPGNFKDKEAEKDFLETWRQGGNGLNRHKDRLLKYGVKYTPFSVQNNDAQFLETLREMVLKICRLWNMPPHLVGSLERATFSNIEQQSVEFVVYTLGPWITALEQACRRDLLVGADASQFFVEFNVSGLLRGDFKTRFAGYAQARQWGWMSVNDIRKLENMKGIGAKGDIYLSPINMQDADEVGENDPDADQPGAPGPDDQQDPATNPNDPLNKPETTDGA